MKSQAVSRSEAQKFQSLLNFRSEKKEIMQHAIFLAAIKLCPLLGKLKPLYSATAVSKIVRIAIALFLCVGLVNPPVFAADNVLSQNYVAPPAEITLAAAEAQTASTTSGTLSAADDFVTAGSLSVATVVAPGRSLYVSTTGSDTASGSESAAFKTIAYAVSQLQAGDTLYIEAGTYQQPAGGAVFTTSGTSDAPITIKGLGNVVIQGTTTTTISGYTVAANYNPAFDTKGQDYINFENLTVNNLRAAVTVSPNSSYIMIDGLKSDRNHFAVLINGGDHVTVRNAVVTNSRNGFRTEATTGVTPTDILYENIDVSGSADVYSGFEPRYRNGDGFILEFGNRITLRNVVSHDNWDAGFDVKATNVLMENVTTYGNKNNFKVWGSGITVKNSLSYGAKIRTDDPVAGEGYGVNARMGQIKFINTTFVDNENADIRADNDGGPSSVTLENCIMARQLSSGSLQVIDGGSIADKNSIWYKPAASADFTMGGSSIWADPKFVNWNSKDFHLQSESAAIDFGSTAYAITALDFDNKTRVVGSSVDLGAYEYQGGTTVDTTVPVISAVSTSNVSSAGATINWATNEASDSQVEFRVLGATAWIASSVNLAMVTNHSMVVSGLNAGILYEYRVKSKDQAGNLATQGTVSSFTTLTSIPTTSCTTAICGVTAGQTVSGTLNVQPNLSINTDIRKVAYYLNGNLVSREYTSPFIINAGAGLDTTTLADGNYTLGGAYTTVAGDQNFSIAFTVKNSIVSADTTAPVISAVVSSSVTSGGAVIAWTTNEASDTQVEYRVLGATVWSATALNASMVANHSMSLSGLLPSTVYEFRVKSKDQAGNLATQATVSSLVTLALPDTTAPAISAVTAGSVTTTGAVISWTTNEASDSQVEYRVQGSTAWLATNINAAMVTNHSLPLSGLTAGTVYEFRVKSKDQAGNLATQAVVSSLTTLAATTACTTAICGVTAGSTVSGNLKVQPNLTLNPGIRKVFYYLDGNVVSKEYSAPFTINAGAGLDTTKLSNGTHTLAGSYTTTAGDVNFSFTFTVNNSVVAPPLTQCTTAMCGVTSGQTVGGKVMIQPNLALYPDIRKVFYYLNGVLVSKEYSAPFAINAGAGFDTTKLANGNHTISGSYTTAAGDIPFTISFTVQN